MKKVSGLIYTPQGRAREYSQLACNMYKGDCAHECAYCYMRPMNKKFKRSGPPALRSETFINDLEKQAARLNRQGVTGRVMLCFTTDPYQPLDVETALTREVIQVLHKYGFAVQVLTKGGNRALRDLDLFDPGDAFAVTMTTLNCETSRRWEPGATLPDDRLETLKKFHDAGVETWVSLEPVIDPIGALEIIQRSHTFVDLFKVGKLNHAGALPDNLRAEVEDIDWANFATRAVKLLESLGVAYYVKDDLRTFLPADMITAANSTPPDDAGKSLDPAQLSLL
jgi:DNA repair photolyase